MFSSLSGDNDMPIPNKLKKVTKLDRPREFICCVSASKDTYKPGQIVRIKGIILNAVSGEPDTIYKLFEAEKNKVGIYGKIVGPSGSDVMNSKLLNVPNRSVVSFDWKIPLEQAGGEYTIKIECKQKDGMSVFPFFPVASRTFNVQVYRPPRFKMDLEFVRKAYGEGDSVKAVLKVRRAEGNYPDSATVEATCRLDGVEIYRNGDYKVDPKNGICHISFDLPKEIKEGIGSLTCAVTEGATESISKTLPIILKKIKCNVYPESGELVEGLPCGCYFETFNTSGDPAELWGCLIKEEIEKKEKTEEMEIKTYHEGRGVFEFTPEKGFKYSIRVDKPSGVVYPIDLPEVKKFGVSLRLAERKTVKGNKVVLKVGSTEELSCLVAIFRKDVLIDSKQVKLDPKVCQDIELDSKNYDGVIRASVFYCNSKYGIVGYHFPLAERLFMVHPKDEIIYDIRRTKSEYRPGEKVKLWITPKLKSTGESVKSCLSVCVTDDSVLKITEKRKRPPRLFSQYYLESEVKEVNDHQRYISPQIVETELEKKIKSYVCTDLLLGVQGWRRYLYKNYKEDPKEFYKQMNENLKDDYFRVLCKPEINDSQNLPKEIPELDGDELIFESTNSNKLSMMDDSSMWTVHRANKIEEQNFEFSVKINQLNPGSNTFGIIIGIMQKNHAMDKHLGYNRSGWGYIAGNGRKNFSSSSGTRYGESYGAGDIITCIKKKNSLEFKKNNVSQGIAFKNLKRGEFYIAISTCCNSVDLELIQGPITDEMLEEMKKIKETMINRGNSRGSDLYSSRSDRSDYYSGRSDNFSRKDNFYGRRSRGRGGGGRRPPPPRAMMPMGRMVPMAPKRMMSRASPRMMTKRKKGRISPKKEFKSPPMFSMEQKEVKSSVSVAKPMVSSSLSSRPRPKEKKRKKKSSRRIRIYDMPPPPPSRIYDGGLLYTPPTIIPVENTSSTLPYSVTYYHETPVNRPVDAERNDFTETLLWIPSKMTQIKKNQKGEVKNQIIVSFDLCDSVSSFRILIDGFTRGGVLGQSYNHVVKVVKPFYIEPKIPLEICFKDISSIPIACVNNMDQDIEADLSINTDFNLFNISTNKILVKIKKNSRTVTYVDLQVKNAIISEKIPFVIDAIVPKFRLTDKVKKEISVSGYGFPLFWNFSGMFGGKLKKEEFIFKVPITLIPGTLQTYSFCSPTPAANMTQAMKGLIRAPYGCFEQIASTLYPMCMANIYFSEKGIELGISDLKRMENNIDSGYKKLVGYQLRDGACDWYGCFPGNESLTAMGINLFTQLQRVWPVSPNVIKKAAKWLISRKKKDNTGFKKHSGKYAYGYAPDDTTNAYILWAISNCSAYINYKDVQAIVEHYIKKTESLFRTPDSYVMALLCLALFNFNKEEESLKLAKQILKHQKDNGRWAGNTSICKSYGSNLSIETTALCAMALMNFEDDSFSMAVVKAISWLMKHNSYGSFGSTQGTCLSIQCLVKYYNLSEETSEEDREMIKMELNSIPVEELEIPKNTKESLFFKDFSESIGLREQENKMVISTNFPRKLPYSMNVACKITKPIVDVSELDFTFSNKLASTKVKEGDSTEIEVEITNKIDKELGMIIAIIALPGGLEVRVPKLKELKKQEVFSFYELFGARKVVFYWRGMKSNEKINFKFDVLAQVPGNYTGECSSCYLYYNDDVKYYENALMVDITKK